MPSITRRIQSDRAGRAAAMRRRALEAVEKLLEGGTTFTELSVEQIIGEIGISRSTFYVYFEDKGHLLRALTEDTMGLMLTASRGWWLELSEADYDELERGITELVRTYREHSVLMAAIVDTSTYDPGVRAELHELIGGGQVELAKQIRLGQEAGSVRPELDPGRTAGWLAWMVEHGLHELVREVDDAEAERLAKSLALVLWNALYLPG